jgi:regulator of RNase E activity RraA
VHIVETGTPVTIGGLAIRPGEIIHGDQSGVQVVPTALLDGIPSAASAIAEREQAVIAECRKPNASVEGIRELLRRINS